MQDFFEAKRPDTGEIVKLAIPIDCPYFKFYKDTAQVDGWWFYISKEFHWHTDFILGGELRNTHLPVMAAVASEWWSNVAFLPENDKAECTRRVDNAIAWMNFCAKPERKSE